MRTFRITLSHGNEHVTFDGAGARSGSMFHVRRDAIEGLWSSPASKVSLTERETANGASPISDGETLYAARTVVIPFAIQSNYNHTNLIRARTLLGRLIGWHDVRMDVNDDGDETVLYGYIEAKYSDIPYDHADAGVITVVCPDPRRISKHASTISMNTSSNSLGGLSFGVPAYELAWTGTPNASTSTLSQDGNVVATNLFTDSRMRSKHADYQCKGVQNEDGTWTYAYNGTGSDVRWQFEVPLPDEMKTLGSIVVLTADHHCDEVGLQAQTRIQASDTMAVYRITSSKAIASASSINFYCNGGWGAPNGTMGLEETITPTGVMMLTADDYTALQALGVDCFSGDSQSPQPNAGLAFPLDFGQTGNTGNTGMIDNNGSYTSMPTITAHGWLDNGLTIHWNTSDGNEGDLSYMGSIQNVPVTIDTDTHSAIMGGLDVSYLLGSRDWPRIPAGGSCSFALLASGNGWVTVQSHDTYM